MYPVMAQPGLRYACVGTYTPRQCGIATFSCDLCEAICTELGNERACHNQQLYMPYAMSDSATGFSIVPLDKLLERLTA